MTNYPPQNQAVIEIIQKVWRDRPGDSTAAAVCLMYKTDENFLRTEMILESGTKFSFGYEELDFVYESEIYKLTFKLKDHFLFYYTSDTTPAGMTKLNEGAATGIYFGKEGAVDAPYLNEEFIRNMPVSETTRKVEMFGGMTQWNPTFVLEDVWNKRHK